jgi:hypothetical protein
MQNRRVTYDEPRSPIIAARSRWLSRYEMHQRTHSYKITYTAGAMENVEISHTVNVLKGTKRPFNNRRSKYQ